jgi:peptidyl-tRNA hydrolase, PTH2 family
MMGDPTVYVVIRRDLKMRRGKEIAQGIHAVARLGYVEGAPVVVLQAPDYEAMKLYAGEAAMADVPCAFTKDAGRTEVEPGTVTALAIGPVHRYRLKHLSEAPLY